MSRYIRVIFLTCLSVIILTLAVANRELVDVRLLPSEFDGFLGVDVSLSIPVFVLFLSGVIFGLFVQNTLYILLCLNVCFPATVSQILFFLPDERTTLAAV